MGEAGQNEEKNKEVKLHDKLKYPQTLTLSIPHERRLDAACAA